MKRSILLASLAMVSALSFGQTKLDLQLSSLVKEGKVSAAHQTSSGQAKGINNGQSVQTVTVIGELAKGALVPEKALEDMGIKVTLNSYGMVIMNVPTDKIQELEALKEFTSLEADKPLHYTNYTSHEVEHVLELHDAQKAQAEGLPQAYNGEGVILGTLDCGFDFNHVNFRDPVTHKSRFKMVMRRKGSNDGDSMFDEKGHLLTGIDAYNIYTGEAIDTLTTDFRAQSHGSHTLGTSAGSYEGDYLDKDGNVAYTNLKGTAYKADIVAAGTLDNSKEGVITVTDQLIKYADSVGKPIVLSYSFGSYGDWLDGKTAYNKYFDNLTDNGNKPGRIVCMSSGNSGNEPFTIYKELNESNNYTIKTCVPFLEKEKPIDVMIFNSNDADLDISYEILNEKLEVTKSLTMKELEDLGIMTYQKSSDHDNRTNAKLKMKFIGLDGKLTYYGEARDSFIVITVKSKDRIVCKPRMYCMIGDEPHAFINMEGQDWTPGDDKSSFGWTSCSNSVVSVGSWTANHKVWLYLVPKGGISAYDFAQMLKPTNISEMNDISHFSSYVITDDNGKSHPDVCAPGFAVISGTSNYDLNFFDKDGNPNPTWNQMVNVHVSGKAREEYGRQDGRSSYIKFDCGTSMSCPNVAGIIALWLQANPMLTSNQVHEVIRATADNDEFTAASPAHFGAGKINALAGLKYILKNYPTAIHEVENGEPKGIEEPMVKKVMDNGRVIILKNGIKYNAAGQRL